MQETLVVVGMGMAGQQFCESMVRRGGHRRYRIVAISEEAAPPYDRVHLHDYFHGRTLDNLLLRPQSWYADHGMELRLAHPVRSIDRTQKMVHFAAGTEPLRYQQLVLATGSDAAMPPIPGLDAPGVFAYRSIADVERISARLSEAQRVLVIGGGVLGLEVAISLHGRGLPITLLESAAQLLNAHLDPDSAAVLRERCEVHGMRVICPATIQQVENASKSLQVSLADGDRLEADLIIVAAGIRPRDQLARACDLPLGARGGIRVDDRLATADPNIHAIGECAVHPQNRPGSIAAAYEMADVLAASLTGSPQAFRLNPSPFLSKSRPADLGVITYGMQQGINDSHHQITVRSEGSYRRLLLRERVPVGLSAVGEWPELGLLQAQIRAQQPLSAWRLWRFRRTGRVYSSLTQHQSYLSGSATVCHCMGITRTMLTDSYSAGHTSVDALAKDTGASTVCGNCAPALRAFTGQPGLATVDTRTRKMLFSSIAAFLLILYFWIAEHPPGPVPFNEEQPSRIFNAMTSETSGYLALGFAVLGLTMSARKYVPAFTLGSLAFWRMVHTCLGLACVGVVMVHTRLQLGSGFNAWLMVDFLALVLIGTLLGMLMAGELYLNRYFPGLPTSRLRQRMTFLHRCVYSLFPILLLFHVLSSYYY